MNRINSILEQFDEDDFIVFKLDIDTSSIEIPLLINYYLVGKTVCIIGLLINSILNIMCTLRSWLGARNGVGTMNGTIFNIVILSFNYDLLLLL